MSRLRVVISITLGVVLAVALLAPPAVAEEEEGVGGLAEVPEASPDDPRTFGPATVAHTVPAFGFHPLSSTVEYSGFGGFGSLFCSASPCTFDAPLMLPAGASVTGIEAEICDTDPTTSVQVVLNRVGPHGTAFTNLVTTQSTGTPGCIFLPANLDTPETINNFTNQYFLGVGMGSTSATRFFAVRVFYNLQVSAAPAVARFSDVPTTHPFFRFVEALAASGITAGCGVDPPRYCPNDPVTRGQMAVFLSRALGLHFAP